MVADFTLAPHLRPWAGLLRVRFEFVFADKSTAVYIRTDQPEVSVKL